MPEEKNECRTGMPCGLPKSGNACMNRTTACCLKCGWNPDEQVRRRALPLVGNVGGCGSDTVFGIIFYPVGCTQRMYL